MDMQTLCGEKGAKIVGSIHEFCSEFHITLGKARRMEKRGWLRVDSNATPIDEIRMALKRGQKLTVAQLVELIERPAGILELGKYASKAEEQLAALRDPKSQVAPKIVAANVLEAFQNDPQAVEIVARWLASIIPAAPVGHAYLATRLLLGVPENIRKYDVPHMQRVLMNCRQHPALKGLWRTEREKTRNVTVYQKIALDL
jgi:hypothetical protein